MKVNAMSYAHLVRMLVEAEYTYAELAEGTGLHYSTVRDYLNAMHKARAVFVVRWEPDAYGRHNVKVFKLGNGRDAKRPRLTSAERRATGGGGAAMSQTGKRLLQMQSQGNALRWLWS